MESDISDDDGGFGRQTTKGGDDNDDDWDMDSEGEVDDDANMAGEMVGFKRKSTFRAFTLF